MKLVEKKCPNCGATLEFNDSDKSCVCSYCHRAFEIERNDNAIDFDNQFLLNAYTPTSHVISPKSSIILFVFCFVFIIIVSAFLFFSISHFHKSFDDTLQNSSWSDLNTSVDENEDEEDKNEVTTDSLIKNVDELGNDQLESINRRSLSIVNQSTVGRSDTTYSYQKTGDPRLEKVYVAYQEGHNYIISIYRVIYHNFFNQSDQQTVYVPAVFENVEKSISFSLKNGKNPAPEYYLNSEQSTYIYAFSSFEDAYNNIVQPLHSDYLISEK